MIQSQSAGALMKKVVNSGDTYHDVSLYTYLYL